MPTPLKPNPYSDRLMRELSVLSAKMSRELYTPANRTQAQRQELVWRCRMLFDAIAKKIDPSVGGATIDTSDSSEDIALMFGSWYNKELEALRRAVLMRAAEYVLGKDAYNERSWNHYDRRGYKSEVELKAQLVRLDSAAKDRLRQRQKAPSSPSEFHRT
jgi:hypothetical protein